MSGPTPEQREALAEVLLAPCGSCGHWPGDHHVDSGCSKCRRCDRDMLAVEVDSVVTSSWLADMLATARADALRDARDALYRGDGPDLYADADLIYGEWLGNRADRAATEAGTDG